MSLLRVRGLGRSFGGVQAVAEMDIDVHPGELLALIGPNGAGKSTTFNMINGQLRPTTGSIELAGQSLLGRSPRQISRLGVGRTFQIAATFASLTVVENVQMALLSHARRTFALWPLATHMLRDQALALLDQVGMVEQAARPCNELAYGDVKRVELAVALANEPRLLLMDEPTAGMAATERLALMALTRDLVRERQMAVLFTEHSMDVVFAYADRVMVLARGRIIAQGAAADIRRDPRVQEVYLGTGRTFESAQPAPHESAPSAAHEYAPSTPHESVPSAQRALGPAAPEAGLKRHSAGSGPHATNVSTPSVLASTAETVLCVNRLNAWYGGAHILFDVGLTVRRGEVVALMGRNGAGKSTTLKSIMGMVERRRGEVSFLGQDVSNWAPHRVARAGLGFVPEERRIFTDLTVLENLQTGEQPPRYWPDGRPAVHWSVEQLFELFPNLRERQHHPAAHMSGGEQQMLTVARTLMGNPWLVLLDEPSEGVAPVIVEQMAHAILALKAQGVSILLSEQNMHFAQWVSDRVYVLEKGVVRFEGSMQALAADPARQHAYLTV